MNQGRVFVVENRADGHAAAVQHESPGFSPSAHEGVEQRLISGAGVDLCVFKGAPHAVYDVHPNADHWIGVVVAGSGTLELADEDGKVESTVEFQGGDVFVFKPRVMHGWKNGPRESVFVFARRSMT